MLRLSEHLYVSRLLKCDATRPPFHTPVLVTGCQVDGRAPTACHIGVILADVTLIRVRLELTYSYIIGVRPQRSLRLAQSL